MYCCTSGILILYVIWVCFFFIILFIGRNLSCTCSINSPCLTMLSKMRFYVPDPSSASHRLRGIHVFSLPQGCCRELNLGDQLSKKYFLYYLFSFRAIYLISFFDGKYLRWSVNSTRFTGSNLLLIKSYGTIKYVKMYLYYFLTSFYLPMVRPSCFKHVSDISLAVT